MYVSLDVHCTLYSVTTSCTPVRGDTSTHVLSIQVIVIVNKKGLRDALGECY